MTRTLRLTLLAVAVVALATLNLAMCSSAEAHPYPAPRTCSEVALAQARAVPPATYYEYRRNLATCKATATRHAILHCRAMPGGMGSAMCAATVAVKPAWATDHNYHELLRRESTWSTNSVNEVSGACGAFQRLPCPWRYSGGGSGPADDRVYSTALQQVRNGAGYITGRYGTPSAAIRFHNAHHWY